MEKHTGLDAYFIPPKRPRRYRTEEERLEARRDTWRRANKKYRAKKKAEQATE